MFQDQSELFHECGCESSLGQRQEWQKHLGTASAEGKQLKMEVKIEDLLNAARFCQDLQLSTTEGGVECPVVLHRSP